MRPISFSFLLLTPLVAFADNAPSCYEQSCCTELTCDACDCSPGPRSSRLSARHRQGNGIGYPRGYSTLDLFSSYSPSFLDSNTYFFLDLRGHINTQKKWSTNAGVGARYLDDCHSVVYGLNFFWDWREARHTNFHQLGGGLEFLMPCWDLRFNGYAPLSLKDKTYKVAFDKFQGNQAIFERKQELSMWGVDGAVGYWLYNCGSLGFHTSLTGYYFRGKHGKNFGGGILRAKGRFSDFMTLQGQVCYDNEFNWIGQAEFAVHVPFGRRVKRRGRCVSSCCDLLSLEYRIVEQVERFEIPVTTTRKTKETAIDPLNGQPLTFIFVDNTSNSLGTFESPYPNLKLAENFSSAGDVIYVFPGDGTTQGMDEMITLQDRQSLVGSGAPFTVATRFGNVEIPAQTTTLPKITWASTTPQQNGEALLLAPPPPAITLGNGNTISGINLSSSGTSSISGSNITGFTLQNSTITADSDTAIFVEYNMDDLVIRNSSISCNGQVTSFGAVIAFSKSNNLFIENSSISATNHKGILITQTLNDVVIKNSSISLESKDTPSPIHGIEIEYFQGRDFIFQNSIISATPDPNLAIPSPGILLGSLYDSSYKGGDIRIQNSFLLGSGYGIKNLHFSGRNFIVDNSSISTAGGDCPAIEFTPAYNSTYTLNDFVISNSTIKTQSVGSKPPTVSAGIYTAYDDKLNIRDFICRDTLFDIFNYDQYTYTSGIYLENQNGDIQRDFIVERSTIIHNSPMEEVTFYPIYISKFEGRNLSVTNSNLRGGGTRPLLQIDEFAGENALLRNCSLRGEGSCSGFRIDVFDKGTLTVQDSNISTESSSVAIEKNFSGSSILIERNTITSKQGKGIEIARPSADTQMIIQNNQIAAYQEALRVDPILGILRADILNNRFISNDDTHSFFPVHLTTGESGQLRLRYWKNTAVSKAVSGGSDVFFENNSSVFQVESPNLEQTGLGALNDGTFQLQNITFIPFE